METKGFFLLHSHIGAISKTAVPLPGVPNSLTRSLSPSLSHPSCLLLIYENIKRETKGPTKVVQRMGDKFYAKPLLLFTLSLAVQVPSPVQIAGILEQWSYPTTTEDTLLSQVPPLIRADDFSVPTNLTHGGWVCA